MRWRGFCQPGVERWAGGFMPSTCPIRWPAVPGGACSERPRRRCGPCPVRPPADRLPQQLVDSAVRLVAGPALLRFAVPPTHNPTKKIFELGGWLVSGRAERGSRNTRHEIIGIGHASQFWRTWAGAGIERLGRARRSVQIAFARARAPLYPYGALALLHH